MNKVTKFAVAAAVSTVLGTTGMLLPGLVKSAAAEDAAPAAPAAPAKPQVSSAAGPDLLAAQKAYKANNFEDALGLLEKVKNNPKKNDYDEYVMNQFYASIYGAQNKPAEAETALEALMASKYMPPDELKRRLASAAIINYNSQNYDKAIDFGNRALNAGGGDRGKMQTVVAQAYFLKNDFKGTDHFIRSMVDEQIKAGQTPTEDMLNMGRSSAVKLNDDPGINRWLELLVTYHPKPSYWDNLLASLYTPGLSDKALLQLYRLSSDVGVLKNDEYPEMAQLALAQGSPGEAVATLTKGFAANAFTTPADKNRNQHLLDSAKKDAAADQAGLAKTEADAASAAHGDPLVAVGIGYFGYGQYDKAAKDIEAGLDKGITKDPQDARLLLGIAQYKAGNAEGAAKAFKSVKGDITYERLAALWAIRAKA